MEKLIQLKKKLHRKKGFTLIEMVLVLFIISLLLLLIMPNMMKQKEAAEQKADAAIVKTVEGQLGLYEATEGKKGSIQDLVQAEYITEDQAKKYQEIQANK